MIVLKNITYEIDGKKILDNVNLTIEDRFVVITGPNGSGKSTLAKIIMGIVKPTSGQIIFNGEDITNLLQQQTLTVKGKDHDTKLIVTFCKQSQKPRKDTDTVETGDSVATAGYLSIILLSAGFIIFVRKKKEKQHDKR